MSNTHQMHTERENAWSNPSSSVVQSPSKSSWPSSTSTWAQPSSSQWDKPADSVSKAESGSWGSPVPSPRPDKADWGGEKAWGQSSGERNSWGSHGNGHSNSGRQSAWNHGNGGNTSSNWGDKGTSSWGSNSGAESQWDDKGVSSSSWPASNGNSCSSSNSSQSSWTGGDSSWPKPKSVSPSCEKPSEDIVSNPDGWGKLPVRQDVKWDVDVKARADSALPPESSNQWQNNNGTAIWETCKAETVGTSGTESDSAQTWNGASSHPHPAQRSNSWGPQQHTQQSQHQWNSGRSDSDLSMWGSRGSGHEGENRGGNNRDAPSGSANSSSSGNTGNDDNNQWSRRPQWKNTSNSSWGGNSQPQSNQSSTPNRGNGTGSGWGSPSVQRNVPKQPSVWESGGSKVETGNWEENQWGEDWQNSDSSRRSEIDNGTALWHQQSTNPKSTGGGPGGGPGSGGSGGGSGGWGEKEWPTSTQQTNEEKIGMPSRGGNIQKLVEQGYSKEAAQNALISNNLEMNAALNDLANKPKASSIGMPQNMLQPDLQRLVNNRILPNSVLQFPTDETMLKQIQTLLQLHQLLQKMQSQKKAYQSTSPITPQTQMSIHHVEQTIQDLNKKISEVTRSINNIVNTKTLQSAASATKVGLLLPNTDNNPSSSDLSNDFSQLKISQAQPYTAQPSFPTSQSKLSMWKDSKVSSHSVMAPPGGISITESTWSTCLPNTMTPSWPNSEQGDKDDKGSASGGSGNTVIHEFVPGKPWTGFRNPEEDDYATPASMIHPLSVSHVKNEYIESTLQSGAGSHRNTGIEMKINPPYRCSSFVQNKGMRIPQPGGGGGIIRGSAASASFNRSQSWAGTAADRSSWDAHNRINVAIKNLPPGLQEPASLKSFAAHYNIAAPIRFSLENNGSCVATFPSLDDAERFIFQINGMFGHVAQLLNDDARHYAQDGWSTGGGARPWNNGTGWGP